MKYYSKEQLDDLNIYELRYLAREKGVKSPTTKKRDELIVSIIALQEGREMPAKKSRQGRPAKAFDLCSSNLLRKGVFIDNDFFNNHFSSNLVFRSAYAPYNKQQEIEEEIEIAGYLAKYNNEYCLLGFENPMGVEVMAVTDEMNVNKYNILIGDYVFCKCKFIVGSDVPILQEVITINSQPISYMPRGHFKLLKPSFEKKSIMSENKNNCDKEICEKLKSLKSGDKVLIKSSSLNNLNFTLTEFTKALCDDAEIVTIIFGGLPEQVNYYQNNLKSTVFFSLFSDSYEQQKYLYDLAIQYAKNQVVGGRNIILVVSTLSQLENFSNKSLETDFEPLQIKELYSLARNTQKNTSITIVGVVENENAFIIDSLLPYIDMIIEK